MDILLAYYLSFLAESAKSIIHKEHHVVEII